MERKKMIENLIKIFKNSDYIYIFDILNEEGVYVDDSTIDLLGYNNETKDELFFFYDSIDKRDFYSSNNMSDSELYEVYKAISKCIFIDYAIGIFKDFFSEEMEEYTYIMAKDIYDKYFEEITNVPPTYKYFDEILKEHLGFN